MFIFRRLITTVVILVALALGTSAILESFAESQLSSGIRRTFHLRASPEVQIEAFPILLRVIQGRIPRIAVDARVVQLEGLEIANLTIDMKGVHVSLDSLLRKNRFDIKVDQGKGAARVTEGSINAFLAQEKIDAHVSLRGDGTVLVRTDRVYAGKRRRFEAVGRLTLGARTLTFKPSKVTVDGKPPGLLAELARKNTTFSVEIPKLPGGIVPGAVVVTTGELSLTANLDGYTLKLS